MSAVKHFIRKGVRQAEIDEYLGKELARAGYGGVDITKTPLGERITIYASRPGIVIGRRGKNIRMITDELVSRFGLENPQIEVKEVVNPELNAKVMAFSLVSAIERGVHRRRAAYSVLRRVLNAGARGCEIIIAGKLTSKRSRHEAYRMGLLAKSGEIGSQLVRRANATAVLKLGTIGVTVNIMRGDIPLPDDISILAVQLGEDAVIEEVVTPEIKVKEVEPKKVKEAPKEKEPKKDEKKDKPVTKKKTDLDKKVEELSDLIEKTPSEAKKPKKTKTKKPAVKKTPAAVKTEKPKASAKKDVKKPETKKPKTTKKEDDKAKTTTTKKAVTTKTAAKKVEEKPKAKTTKKITKASTSKKETKTSKPKKEEKKK